MHQVAALAAKYKSQYRRSPPFRCVVLFENKAQKHSQLLICIKFLSFREKILWHSTAVARGKTKEKNLILRQKSELLSCD